MDIGHQLASSHDISTKVSLVWRKRAEIAQRNLSDSLKKAYEASGLHAERPDPQTITNAWTDWASYAFDAAQRSVLFLDTIRQRGNNYLKHVQAGQPPLLHFAYETVVDGRTQPGVMIRSPCIPSSAAIWMPMNRRAPTGSRSA